MCRENKRVLETQICVTRPQCVKKGLRDVVWQARPELSLMREAAGSSETFFHFYHS